MNKTRTILSAGVDNPSRLKMVFLGPPQVELEGQTLRFRTRKALALLIYLALEPGLHPRDKLSALLWPEADDTQGRVSLRGAINHLNRALGERWLMARRDTLGLDGSEPFDLDINTLEAAFKHAGHQNRETNLEATLEAAAQLYRGELLEGFGLEGAPEFDDWILARRELARQWLDTVLERLGELQADSGRLQQALETTLRRVRLEPLNEVAHQHLISLHLRMGNRAAAVEAYQFCKATLEAELGVAPSPQTEALLQQAEPSTKTPVHEPTAPQALASRLVAREPEWAAMETAWQAGQHILISGEPGVGKSRLMMEFAAKKGTFAPHLGRPGDQAVPFSSIARGMRHALEVHPNLDLPTWVCRELSRLLPELSGETLPPLSTQDERFRLFEAVKCFYDALGKLGLYPLADDLQFFDDSSIEMVAYLMANHPEPSGRYLLSAFRPLEVSAPFKEVIRQMVEAGHAVLIELQPLETKAVDQMLSDLIPGGSNLDQLASVLHRFTGGNPMFVLETVRSLAQRGSLHTLTAKRFEARRRVAGLPRSPKVTAVIGRRLERLSGSAKELSRVAAIMGEQFSLERAAKVLNTSLLSLAPACEELEATQVWRGQKFSHDLLYETTLEGIPESLRPILHGQVLDMLEGSNTPASILAHHAIAAGREEAGFRYSYQAGIDAFKLSALPEAVEHLERARIMGNASEELWKLLTEEQRYTLYDALFESFRHSGLNRPERREPIAAEMSEFAHNVHDADVGRKISISLGFHHFFQTLDDGPILQALNAHLEQVRHTHDRLQEYWALNDLAAVNAFQNRYSQALVTHTQALELAYQLRDEVKIGNSLEGIGTQYWLLGEWKLADEKMTEGRLHFTAKDRIEWTALPVHLAWNLVHFGRAREAIPKLQAVVELRQHLHHHAPTEIARSRLIISFLEVGEYGKAYTLMKEHQEVRRRSIVGDAFTVPAALLQLKLGKLEDARAILRENDPTTGLAAPHYECGKRSLATGLYALEGNWIEACRFAVRASLAREALGFERFFTSPFMPRWLETEALLREGYEDMARESLRRLDEASEPYQRLRVAYLRSLAVLQAWEHQTDLAIASLEEAKSLALEMHLPGEIWEVEARLAELFAANGEHHKAQQARTAAMEGIHWVADRIEDVEVRRRFLEFAQKQVIKEVPTAKI